MKSETPARILILEDDYLIALEQESILKSAGYVVVGPVACVDHALQRVAEQPIDAALLDITVVGGTSLCVAQALAAIHCPFAFVTGYANPPIELASLGDVKVLRKPVDPDELLATVHELIRP